jgi:NAD(P)-dependent dehydrogenase (short-subunit alcohol dehydrogenase family)
LTSTDDTPVPDYQKLLRLDGRRFVVVGAGQGIGRQTSHALASAGAKLVCVDNRDDLAKEIADEVGGIACVADATQRDDADRAIAVATNELGGLDGLVDIVGMARYGPAVDASDDDWEWTFDIVLRHAFVFAQAAAKAMTAGSSEASPTTGKSMVFVASVSGISSAPMHAPYGAAKAGLMSWVRSLAVELGPKSIRVNAVAPGMVWTPRISQFVGKKGREQNERNTPLRRVAQPSDIASGILFLASDLAGYVTGQTLIIDGGVGVKFPYPMNM